VDFLNLTNTFTIDGKQFEKIQLLNYIKELKKENITVDITPQQPQTQVQTQTLQVQTPPQIQTGAPAPAQTGSQESKIFFFDGESKVTSEKKNTDEKITHVMDITDITDINVYKCNEFTELEDRVYIKFLNFEDNKMINKKIKIITLSIVETLKPKSPYGFIEEFNKYYELYKIDDGNETYSQSRILLQKKYISKEADKVAENQIYMRHQSTTQDTGKYNIVGTDYEGDYYEERVNQEFFKKTELAKHAFLDPVNTEGFAIQQEEGIFQYYYAEPVTEEFFQKSDETHFYTAEYLKKVNLIVYLGYFNDDDQMFKVKFMSDNDENQKRADKFIKPELLELSYDKLKTISDINPVFMNLEISQNSPKSKLPIVIPVLFLSGGLSYYAYTQRKKIKKIIKRKFFK
jgi:hypothetical protein